MPDKKSNLEQQMIRHCAPVLAGMKVANLFRYQAETEECLQKEMEGVSQKLNGKGVHLEIVRRFEKDLLCNEKSSAKSIAEMLNVSARQVERCISNLKKTGQIERVGSNRSGVWKVNM